MPEATLVDAINLALARALADDPDVVVFGEDVGVNGGVFRATAGLQQRFGAERVARYLQVADPTKVKSYYDVIAQVMRRGRIKQEPAGTVFARFLNYLRHVELPSSASPMPEMSWFVTQ